MYVTDWTNVRHVPFSAGRFDLERNIATIRDFIRTLHPGLSVIGVCQGGASALAATALLAKAREPTPSALVLIGAPIDPQAHPTQVVKLLGSRPINWFDANLISEVEPQYLGCDRPVYAAQRQLTGLLAYFARHFGDELWVKLRVDDGRDATSFPFADLVTSIMDIDAAFFLENIRHIYQERALAMGTMVCEGASVDLQALRDTALLTVEGTWDDIAAPGQTSAAHILCTSIPSELHASLVVPRSGHFSLFHGQTWRRDVLPVIRDFCCRYGER